MTKNKPTEVPETPITEETFTSQGWEKHYDDDDEVDEYYYWILPLPKDNPDELAPCLISSANDEWDILEIPEGTYVVELANSNGIGYCITDEQIEILYHSLTGCDIYKD